MEARTERALIKKALFKANVRKVFDILLETRAQQHKAGTEEFESSCRAIGRKMHISEITVGKCVRVLICVGCIQIRDAAANKRHRFFRIMFDTLTEEMIEQYAGRNTQSFKDIEQTVKALLKAGHGTAIISARELAKRSGWSTSCVDNVLHLMQGYHEINMMQKLWIREIKSGDD